MGENLGQHFLTDTQVVEDMITAGNITKNDTVLEIGPGKGVLTDKLLAAAGRIVAIEKDPKLADKLRDRFQSHIKSNTLQVLTDDIRDISLTDIQIGESNYKIIANIPYYLTSDILQQFISHELQPKRIVLLTQKEVAERITCADDKHSRMSVFVQAYGNPALVKSVSKHSFNPPPEVTSAILRITDIDRDFFDSLSEQDFFGLVKAGFQHKRKQLKNNLKAKSVNIQKFFGKCDIKKTARAESLTLNDWRCLTKNLNLRHTH